tara:strand:- start:91 stop:267 length:177 start_codon:yes stop_codon:yes gene_type:complete
MLMSSSLSSSLILLKLSIFAAYSSTEEILAEIYSNSDIVFAVLDEIPVIMPCSLAYLD